MFLQHRFSQIRPPCQSGGCSRIPALGDWRVPVMKQEQVCFCFIINGVSDCPATPIRLEQFTVSQQNPSPGSEIILYQAEDGRTRLDVKLVNNTVWLSLNQMAELFQRDNSVISKHIKNVFEEGELKPDSVVAKFATTAADGKTYQVEYFNLDVIISVGYRVKSQRGTQFRIWATQRLREYLIKGFTMDDERLKNPPGPGATDYFDELLERIPI
jgi:hypothetical protein